MNLIKINKLSEKEQWIEEFRKSYKGGFQKIDFSVFSDHECRFFVVKVGNLSQGYIQILHYTNQIKNYGDGEFWSASAAYVKPAYRKQGVLRFMLEHCVQHHHVRALVIETKRLKTLMPYYRSLGFNYGHEIDDGYLSRLFHDRFIIQMEQSKKEQVAANDESFKVTA